MKRVNTTMIYTVGGDTNDDGVRAEVRTCGGKWVADAVIRPVAIGDHGNSVDARAALVKKLRELADVVERDA